MTIERHRYLIPLEPHKILMRYIDLVKFRDMLCTSSLFFCRADKFLDDPFEGSLTKRQYEFRIKEENLEGVDQAHLKMKKFTLINCWHINENESDAMWKLYLKNNDGVAIQTTCEKLYKSIKKSPLKFNISKVRYIDYDKDIWDNERDYHVSSYNLLIPLVHKRKEFIHENEFRILYCIDPENQSNEYWENEPNSIGKKIKIKLTDMIDKIILPPKSDKSIRDKVEKIINEYGFKFELINSKLNDNPFY